ncbi:trypsin-like peptidase domain-containing protein [Mycolicibacterium thermoresistibile]
MTNHPRYSPPSPPGRRPGGPESTAVPGYPGVQRRDPYQQTPYGYDWRYATQQQFPPSYQPYRNGAAQPPTPSGGDRKPSRAGLFAGALAIAVVSAGIGGGVATLAQPERPADYSSLSDAASAVPAASIPPGTVEQVAAKVVPSVVKLETELGRATEEGSGIILSSDGLILTNHHVVSAAVREPGRTGAQTPNVRTKVTFADGRTAPFTVVGSDPSSDIAVVRATNVTGLTPVTLGSSADLRVGQDVVAIGSPLGLEGTVTTGIVSALNRPVAAGGDARNQNTVLDAIQTDAAINPGNSGGALVNMNGELVGVNSAIATLGGGVAQTQSGSIGLGFAIPVDQAKRIADELIKHGRATHASLGVQVSNEAGTDGAMIVEVTEGGAAAAAGLPAGVVVTKLDDRLINSADALVAAVRSKAPGDTVTLTYVEGSGKPRTVDVTLGKMQR